MRSLLRGTQNKYRKWNGGTWGPHAPRKRTSEANWKLPLRWAKVAQSSGKRPRVFCASLADWLDNKAPQHWRTDLAGLIEATPELDWLLLTKRIENFRKLSPWGDQHLGFPRMFGWASPARISSTMIADGQY